MFYSNSLSNQRNFLLLRFAARLMFCHDYHPLYNHRYQINELWQQRISNNLPYKNSKKLPMIKCLKLKNSTESRIPHLHQFIANINNGVIHPAQNNYTPQTEPFPENKNVKKENLLCEKIREPNNQAKRAQRLLLNFDWRSGKRKKNPKRRKNI